MLNFYIYSNCFVNYEYANFVCTSVDIGLDSTNIQNDIALARLKKSYDPELSLINHAFGILPLPDMKNLSGGESYVFASHLCMSAFNLLFL